VRAWSRDRREQWLIAWNSAASYHEMRIAHGGMLFTTVQQQLPLSRSHGTVPAVINPPSYLRLLDGSLLALRQTSGPHWWPPGQRSGVVAYRGFPATPSQPYHPAATR